ncbi:YciI family protein [Amycolatopsis roodepoortensis]|uniref:YciI family protein n=1 Tax=Amycolatopsis roodepoortensis TaxID=700274 RepID=UPI00214B992F|nr:YciI family protein [Amycolatopsis roodepoortensis]UUV29487.1 YciI family protein [Amycolatopsis roodepoortensis]
MGLHPPASATTVRVRGGEALLTDGPFAETKEQIGGIDILERDSREQAVEAAKSHPWAAIGTIEVRELL